MGNILRQSAIARFSRTLGVTFRAGVPLVEAMDAVAGATGSVVYSNAVHQMRDDIAAIPHKTAILPLLGRVSRRAQAAGSVNLVKREADGTLSGDTVDGAGFVLGMEAQGHPVRGASVWLVGLGGAGGAIAAALCEAGVGRLLITELDDARADAGLARLTRFYPDIPVSALSAPSPPKGIHYAINATPLGLRPGDPLSFDPMTLDPDALVAEVIMSPVETPLLQRARTHGRRVHHGRHMLDHQIPLYLEWFGIDAKGIDIVRLVRSINT